MNRIDRLMLMKSASQSPIAIKPYFLSIYKWFSCFEGSVIKGLLMHDVHKVDLNNKSCIERRTGS